MLQTVFPSGCAHLHSHWQEGSPFSTSSPTLVCWFIDDGHRDKWSDTSPQFYFAFLWWFVTWSVFSYVYWPPACLLILYVFIYIWIFDSLVSFLCFFSKSLSSLSLKIDLSIGICLFSIVILLLNSFLFNLLVIWQVCFLLGTVFTWIPCPFLTLICEGTPRCWRTGMREVVKVSLGTSSQNS